MSTGVTAGHADDRRVVIVGGGVHGTYVARELVELGYPREQLLVLDSHGTLLESFRRKARACEMETLRSNYVQHVGASPFGLETFAQARDCECELVPTSGSQRRPTVDLFLDYAEAVVDRFDLDSLVLTATVQDIEDRYGPVIETTAGSVRADHVVLAIGQGGRYRQPEWATDDSRVEHVWNRSVPPDERIEYGDDVVVVGGGITACQTALSLADVAHRVTVWSRHPLETALREADPMWLNWAHIERELNSLPPGSKVRHERVEAARNDATIPPYLRRECRSTQNLSVRQDQIIDVTPTSGGMQLSGTHSHQSSVDRILLAIGFEPVSEHPFLDRIARSLSLSRGYRGWPVLDDETLVWQRSDDRASDISVTGRLAAGTVGPFADNIPGARRAAERLTAHAGRTLMPP